MVLFRGESPAGQVLPLLVVEHLERIPEALGLGHVCLCLCAYRLEELAGPEYIETFLPQQLELSKTFRCNHCKIHLLIKQASIGHTVCLYYSECWNTRIKDKEFMVFWKL